MALADCGGIRRGDVTYIERENSLTLHVLDFDQQEVLACQSAMFHEVGKLFCPRFMFAYLVSLVGYAVMIAIAVLVVFGWTQSFTHPSDRICPFRVALAAYWFGDLGACLFAAVVVAESSPMQGGHVGAEVLLLQVVCTSACTIILHDAPMMIVQCLYRGKNRTMVFVSCLATLAMAWSSFAVLLSYNPSLHVLFGIPPLALACASFLLNLVSRIGLRQLYRSFRKKPTPELDPQLGCFLAISSPIVQDLPPVPEPLSPKLEKRFTRGSSASSLGQSPTANEELAVGLQLSTSSPSSADEGPPPQPSGASEEELAGGEENVTELCTDCCW